MLKEQIEKDFIEAYKTQNAEQVAILRLIKTAIKNQEINLHKDLEEADILALLKKEVKQRETSIEEYVQGNRPDLAEKEKAEIEIIQKYLPEAMSVDEIQKIVLETIQETNATEIKDMGRVIGLVVKKTAGRANNSLVAKLIRELLQK